LPPRGRGQRGDIRTALPSLKGGKEKEEKKVMKTLASRREKKKKHSFAHCDKTRCPAQIRSSPQSASEKREGDALISSRKVELLFRRKKLLTITQQSRRSISKFRRLNISPLGEPLVDLRERGCICQDVSARAGKKGWRRTRGVLVGGKKRRQLWVPKKTP